MLNLKWRDSALAKKKQAPRKKTVPKKKRENDGEPIVTSVTKRLKRRDVERSFVRSVSMQNGKDVKNDDLQPGEDVEMTDPGDDVRDTGSDSDCDGTHVLTKLLKDQIFFKEPARGKPKEPKNPFKRPLTSSLIGNYKKGNFSVFSSRIARCEGAPGIEDIVPEKLLTELDTALQLAKDTAGPLDWGWYDREEKGYDPRISDDTRFRPECIPKKAATMMPNCPEDGSIYFYQYAADYSVNDGILYVNLFSIDSKGRTCVVRASGFNPNLAIRLEVGCEHESIVIHTLDALEIALQKKVSKILAGKKVSNKFRDLLDMKAKRNLDPIIKTYKIVDGTELKDHNRRYKGTYAVVSLAHPSLIPLAKTLLWYPSGNADLPQEEMGNGPANKDGKSFTEVIEPWCATRLLPPQDVQYKSTPKGGFRVYESNIAFTIVFFSGLSITPASWLKVSAGGYKEITWQDPSRVSVCDVEYTASFKLIGSAEKQHQSFKPVMRYLSWDIEALPPGHFPTPKDSPVLVTAYLLADKGVVEHWLHYYVFSLGYLESWAPDVTVFCYDFNDEKTMSEDENLFRSLAMAQVDTGYNTNNFDFYYRALRHEVLGCDLNFMDYTPIRGRPAYSTSKKNRNNQVVTSIKASGIITYDMLRHVFEYMQLENNSLGFAAPKILSGLTKEEFTYDQIESAMDTLRGRTIMAQYCLIDAKLPYLMMMKLNALDGAFQLGNVYHVSPQESLDEGTQFKVMGRLHYKCKNFSDLKRSLPVFIPTYQRQQKTGIKYKGATVLDPVQGFYGGGTVTTQYDSLPKNSATYKMFSTESQTTPQQGSKVPTNMVERDNTPIPYESLPKNRKTLVDFCMSKVTWSKARKHVRDRATKNTAAIKAGAISWKTYAESALSTLSNVMRAGVITLDFRSLYPSIYIVDNMCYCTKITREEAVHMGYKEGIDFHPYYDLDYIDESGKLHFIANPNPPCFMDPKVILGVFPVMEIELSETRAEIKEEMKRVGEKVEQRKMELKKPYSEEIDRLKSLETLQEPEGGWSKGQSPQEKMDVFVKSVLEPIYSKDVDLITLLAHYKDLNLNQDGVKKFMNSMYGSPGAEDSPLPDKVIAMCITGGGRTMLEHSKWLAENKFTSPTYPFVTLVVYGDTDSNMAALIGLEPRKDVLKAAGALMAQYITMYFKEPKFLQFEKVYINMVIGENKKMYAGRKVMVGVMEDVMEVKGMKFKKRGASEFERVVMGKALELLVMNGDSEEAEAYVKMKLHMLVTGKVPTHMLVMSGALGKKIEKYPCMKPVLEVAIRYEDPTNPWKEGDRIEWVYVKGDIKNKVVSDMAEDPDVAIAKGLPINYSQYAELLVRQLGVIFGPVFGGDLKEVERVFLRGKHMAYAVEPFIQGLEEAPSYKDLPVGSRVNYITNYLNTPKTTCVVCKAIVDEKKRTIDDKPTPWAGIITVHHSCSRHRCMVCGRESANGSVKMSNHITCHDCKHDKAKMLEFKSKLPWHAKKANRSLALTAFEAVGVLREATQEAVSCVKQCMTCVGPGNEVRIDTCGAKSCKWWRKGNHAANTINTTVYKMQKNGIMEYLNSKIPAEHAAKKAAAKPDRQQQV